MPSVPQYRISFDRGSDFHAVSVKSNDREAGMSGGQEASIAKGLQVSKLPCLQASKHKTLRSVRSLAALSQMDEG